MLLTSIIGDLLQTIFIQVQKTKVDVDLAMSALDKLLKSNELNFAFLGNSDYITSYAIKLITFIVYFSCCTIYASYMGLCILVQEYFARTIPAKDEKDWFTHARNIKVYLSIYYCGVNIHNA